MSILTKMHWVTIVCVYALATYFLYCLLSIPFSFTEVKADTAKVGVGNFVMAVSYTDSYNDLQYIANFVNCEQAQKYYDDNCAPQGAMIMMCQLEKYLYMPIDHNSDSSFDFEPTDIQSCGFVGVQKPKFIKD